jgi:AraC family transcriptional regulator of adaptative response/methylated-DNA-[protein]-cysteine methyltransferase
MAMTREGLCRLECASGYGLAYDLARWKQEWPRTEFIPDAAASAYIAAHFRTLTPLNWGRSQIALYGTDFQLRVWKTLLQIEPGKVMSYSDVATLVGKPNAGKAVSLAVSSNPVAIIIPSHRVSDPDGVMDNHKRLLLALEERGLRAAG